MSMLKSFLRDRRPPFYMDARADGSVEIHLPAELKTLRLRIIDGNGMTIKVGDWMGASHAGIPDWESKYYATSALLMMANSGQNGFNPVISINWDAAFYLGLMWGRFEKNRGAKVDVVETDRNAEEMDAIIKRFENAAS